MPHDDEMDHLRVGGWFREEAPAPASTALIPYRPRLPARSPADSERAHRVLLACGVAVVTGVAGILALILIGDGEQPGQVAQDIVFPSYEPLTPVSLLPLPASSSAAPAVILPTKTLPVAAGQTTRKPTATPSRTPAPTTTAAPTTPAAVGLVAGRRVGLEIEGRPGVRLRHRNFVARADRITSALDQADSTFVVRTGLAGAGCVSLESVNYPGYFLRHRNFVLRLEQQSRRDQELFNRDATFCPKSTSGGAVVLESLNYPDRALHLGGDDLIHLDQGAGTKFVVQGL
ncbi:hypothetical protein BJ973_001722 [Actinoplanes tereljensis]|uniref:Alpha-L-arabinofuranosidase B arabinose-binding domain-containing protein n=1 Tax=Paractinoplanes tereljensis TaxID=571912 RepID=A0A919TRK2_9ACTN|nr:AbfB domain-containing protein [Actinoplanes tereljensis]GIF20373.1 hypothetical protein Ate02nite_31030 [Actinoplanes tereljensis]